jgi:hypothetical protein
MPEPPVERACRVARDSSRYVRQYEAADDPLGRHSRLGAVVSSRTSRRQYERGRDASSRLPEGQYLSVLAAERGDMDTTDLRSELGHSSFVTAGGTFAAYALIIIGMTLLLFGVPYLIFLLF